MGRPNKRDIQFSVILRMKLFVSIGSGKPYKTGLIQENQKKEKKKNNKSIWEQKKTTTNHKPCGKLSTQRRIKTPATSDSVENF